MAKEVGLLFEWRVLEMLVRSGYKEVAKNYRSRFGEVDLIVVDDRRKCLVFVEVKARSSYALVYGLSAVGSKKRNNIRKTADCFLQGYRGDFEYCRFDVVVVSIFTGSMFWLQDAFSDRG